MRPSPCLHGCGSWAAALHPPSTCCHMTPSTSGLWCMSAGKRAACQFGHMNKSCPPDAAMGRRCQPNCTVMSVLLFGALRISAPVSLQLLTGALERCRSQSRRSPANKPNITLAEGSLSCSFTPQNITFLLSCVQPWLIYACSECCCHGNAVCAGIAGACRPVSCPHSQVKMLCHAVWCDVLCAGPHWWLMI